MLTKAAIHSMQKLLVLFFTLATLQGNGQKGYVLFNKASFERGDSILLNFQLPEEKLPGRKYITAYMMVENMTTSRKWKFRYPILEGKSQASLFISDGIPEGKYAVTFLFSKTFFSFYGAAENLSVNELDYSIITPGNTAISNKVRVSDDGKFSLRGILFEDSCTFEFSAPNNQAKNNLKISQVKTPLDSSFVIDTGYTQIITVGKVAAVNEKDLVYKPDVGWISEQTTLPDVEVTGIRKRMIEKFQDRYSSGSFRQMTPYTFDGLEDNLIAQSINVFEFLKGRVPRLRVTMEGGSYRLSFGTVLNISNGPRPPDATLYLDERKVGSTGELMISPDEIAMIKIYPPTAQFNDGFNGGGANGAIAIYTRRAGFGKEEMGVVSIKVFGYTPTSTIWK